jgi:hypothetical protein
MNTSKRGLGVTSSTLTRVHPVDSGSMQELCFHWVWCMYVLQTGVKVTNVNDLQDIDELCVVEVRLNLVTHQRTPTQHLMLSIACAASSSTGPQFVIFSYVGGGCSRVARNTQLSPVLKLQQLI